MKVAILVNELDVRGGTHKQVLRLCQYLENKDIYFKLFTNSLDLSKTYPEFANFDIECFDISENIDNKFIRVIKRYVKEKKEYKKIVNEFNVVNVHGLGFSNLLFWASNTKKTHTVWQINDLPGCYCSGVSSNNIKSKKDGLFLLLFNILVPKVSAITVNVTKNKDLIKKIGVDAKVFYCGVDENENLQKHSYKLKKEIRLLSTGVFFSYRNYETLINVIKRLRDLGINVRLDIIGSIEITPWYVENIKKQIENLQVSKFVKIWGNVDEETYNKLYNEADVFAFININQSWGLTVFEAMGAGIPTIVSESVGAVELLHDDEDAIIVNPTDVDEICEKIIKLINDEDYYNRISDNGFEAVKSMTWDNYYSSKMLNLFKELCGEDE